MPARPLYLVLSVAALVAVISAIVAGAMVIGPRPDSRPQGALGSPSAATGTPQATTRDEQPAPTGTRAPVPTGMPLPAKDPTPVSLPPEELTGYAWPVRNALITGRVGPREFGQFIVLDGQGAHDGLDLATYCNDRVRAAHDGTVLYAGRNFDPYLGYWGDPAPIYDRLQRLGRVNQQPIVVVIDDGNGYRSVYVHLNKASVEQGMTVSAGDIIGLEGATGYVTGCHLHYTLIRMDGAWQEVVPRLAQYGYPPYVRERVNPLDVLPWADEYAPQRLRDRVLGTPPPSPTPSATPTTGPIPSTTPSPTDTPLPTATPSQSARPIPTRSAEPGPSPSPTNR